MTMMTKAGAERYRRYRGGGGARTGKCHMSCDYLTPKQLKELNGEVHTYQMNRPVRWAEFKEYPAEFQKEYLDAIIEKYNVNYTTLSKMWGIGVSSIKRLIEKNNLGITFTVGHSMTGDQRKAWKQFLSQEQDASDEPVDNNPAPTDDEQEETPVPTMMTRFSLSFQGRIDPASIANSLTQMLGKDAVGQLNIEFFMATPVAVVPIPVYNGQ